MEAIRGKYAIAVSNGSFGFQTGTLAFILEGKNSSGHILGVNIVPHCPEDQSSLQSKLAGIYGIIILVYKICQEHQIMEGEIEVGCDNIEALRRATDMDYSMLPNHTLSTSQPQSNIKLRGAHLNGEPATSKAIKMMTPLLLWTGEKN